MSARFTLGNTRRPERRGLLALIALLVLGRAVLCCCAGPGISHGHHDHGGAPESEAPAVPDQDCADHPTLASGNASERALLGSCVVLELSSSVPTRVTAAAPSVARATPLRTWLAAEPPLYVSNCSLLC